MPKVESTRDNDLLLDRTRLADFDNTCEDVYFFTQREIAVLLSAVRYADWESRWVGRDKDAELVETLRRKLLMLCASDIVKSNLLLVAALTGREIDLSDDAEIENLLNSVQNFSEDGVVPAIDRLAGVQEPDYTEELLAIASVLGVAI